jgi:acetolactate synthase-1/3 small subunit
MEHIISVKVENHFGVLSQISGLLAGRGFNIDSLAVGETIDPKVSRMTIVVNEDAQRVEQVLKQLSRLVEVIEVLDLTETRHVERELMLVKVSTAGSPRARTEVLEVVNLFRAKTVDVQKDAVIAEAVGSPEKLQAMLELLRVHGVNEIARTGRIGMTRG